MPRVLGIDLGTTNSCVAVVDHDAPLVVPVDRDCYTLPSVVAATDQGRLIVGRLAKRQSVMNAENTVMASKRMLGRSFDDPATQAAMQRLSCACERGDDGDVRVRLHERTYKLEEISAYVLGELKHAAEQYFNEPLTQAVITVPAYFNDRQRQATRDAGRIAGLDVLRIINEPTAAALAYGALSSTTDRQLAVFDLGGGTFDVSVLRVRGEVVEVLATAGDAFLGGRDFDDRLVDWLVERVEREHGVPVTNQRNAMQRLREAAETLKHELSEKEEASLTLPFLAAKRDGTPVHLQARIDRATYEGMVEDLVKRTLELFAATLDQAHIAPKSLDEVILVGGMTRTPVVQRRVTELTGKAPASGVHPDLVVAVGAALQGALLSGDAPTRVLVDVTPHNLGIMAAGGIAETVIPKDTAIPTSAKKIFTTASDNQELVKIVVFQGEARRIEKNELLGEFTLTGLRRGARGAVSIEVTFDISVDGIVSVSARDVDTGISQALTVTGRSQLDEAAIARMAAERSSAMTPAPSAAPAPETADALPPETPMPSDTAREGGAS